MLLRQFLNLRIILSLFFLLFSPLPAGILFSTFPAGTTSAQHDPEEGEQQPI